MNYEINSTLFAPGDMMPQATTGHLATIAVRLLNSYFGLSLEMGKYLYVKTSGLPFEEQVELMFPNHEKNAELVASFEQEKEDTIFKQPLFPEVKSVFAALSTGGHRLVISSSNTRSMMEEYCSRTGLKVDLILGYRKGFGKGEAKHVISDLNELSSVIRIFLKDRDV
jgi:hypothetical protein